MKLELSDGMSNHSDFSNDSQNSQMSTADFMASMGNGNLLTPTTTFMTLENLHSGVPTRTTPTVTPTTLRNIEQTFIELQKSEPHENEAGFVPPLVHAIGKKCKKEMQGAPKIMQNHLIKCQEAKGKRQPRDIALKESENISVLSISQQGNNQYISASDAEIYSSKSQNLWQSNLSQSSLSDCDTRSTPPLSLSTNYGNSQMTRRNMGGRKPTKDANISPEEEERRRVRRERNKAAAARCRKRRVDHTNSLIMETEDLERKRHAIQDQIQRLKEEKDELEFILQQHARSGKCKRRTGSPPDVKPFDIYTIQMQCDERVKTEMIEPLNTPVTSELFILPSPKRLMLSTPISKPSRPNSLNVGVTAPQCITDLAGIPISTPSSGLTFNFESLMGGGTGLTPVSAPLVPSCSSQQRNIPISIADLSSPDACNPPKLVSL